MRRCRLWQGLMIRSNGAGNLEARRLDSGFHGFPRGGTRNGLLRHAFVGKDGMLVRSHVLAASLDMSTSHPISSLRKAL